MGLLLRAAEDQRDHLGQPAAGARRSLGPINKLSGLYRAPETVIDVEHT